MTGRKTDGGELEATESPTSAPLTEFDDAVDVLEYRLPADDSREVERKMVRAGHGDTVVVAHQAEADRRKRALQVTKVAVTVLTAGFVWIFHSPLFALAAAVFTGAFAFFWKRDFEAMVPSVVARDIPPAEAKDGWNATDPRTSYEESAPLAADEQ